VPAGVQLRAFIQGVSIDSSACRLWNLRHSIKDYIGSSACRLWNWIPSVKEFPLILVPAGFRRWKEFSPLFYNFYSYWGLDCWSTFSAVVYIPLWDLILGFGVISYTLIHVCRPFGVTCRVHLQGNTSVQKIETCYGIRYCGKCAFP